jgi:hypothetical protein
VAAVTGGEDLALAFRSRGCGAGVTAHELPTPSLACYTAQRLGVRVDGSARL